MHAVEPAVGRPRLDEGWTTHSGSVGFRGTLSSAHPQNQDSREISLRQPMQTGATSRRSAYLAEESPSVEFPSDVDLGLVRAQVEMLNGLLSTAQSSGHVLIYQQRLAEFAQKIREASRLATNLANEVEQSRSATICSSTCISSVGPRRSRSPAPQSAERQIPGAAPMQWPTKAMECVSAERK